MRSTSVSTTSPVWREVKSEERQERGQRGEVTRERRGDDRGEWSPPTTPRAVNCCPSSIQSHIELSRASSDSRLHNLTMSVPLDTTNSSTPQIQILTNRL